MNMHPKKEYSDMFLMRATGLGTTLWAELLTVSAPALSALAHSQKKK
jgi:hypothetical protein